MMCHSWDEDGTGCGAAAVSVVQIERGYVSGWIAVCREHLAVLLRELDEVRMPVDFMSVEDVPADVRKVLEEAEERGWSRRRT